MIIPHTAEAGLATRDEVCVIPRTSSTKILGIHAQSNLKFDTHIAEYTPRASRNLYLLTRVKHYGFLSNNCLIEKIDTIERRAKRFGIISSWRPIKDHIREADHILLQKICGQHQQQDILPKRTENSQESLRSRLPSSSETNKSLFKSIFPNSIICKHQ